MWSEASCTAGQRLNRRYCNYILLLQDLQEADLTVAVVIHPEETQQSYKPVVRTIMHKQRSMDDVKVCDCLCVCVCETHIEDIYHRLHRGLSTLSLL